MKLTPPLAAVTLAVVCSHPASAQNVLEEVIVTAQKRVENLQDTPISLVSLGSDTLRRLAISSVGDIAYHVPNLSMTPFPNSPNAPRLFIRGVGSGDPQVTTDTSVGVYMDGVYLARSIGLGLEVADIERIEVLRGPQGTLYGRNTTGGAVNVVTVRPEDELGFSQSFTAGELGILRSRTMVNLPLGERVAVRAAYALNDKDGMVSNTGQGRDFGSHDKDGLRVDLRWAVSGEITLDYAYDRSEGTFTSHYYQLLEANDFFAGIIPEYRSRQTRAALPSPFLSGESTVRGHTLTLTAGTPFGEFRSITADRRLDDSAYQDYSANPFVSVIQNAIARTEQKQFSQELQLVGSNIAGSLDYVLGVYYFKEEGDVLLVDRIALIDLTLPPVDVSAVNTATAGYAQLTWRPDVQGPWEFTLGARYTEDEREADNAAIGSVDEEFSEFTPSATVRYRVSDTASVYGKVVTGYKSGGFNIRAADFTQPFAPETLTSYEIGFKSEWMGQRLRVNGAAFLADYEDMQLDIVVPGQPNPALTQTENAGKASIAGIELDVQALLAERLQLSVSYGLLDTEIDRVDGDDARFWVLQNAPDQQLSVGVDWGLWEHAGNQLDLALDYTWRDSVFTSARPNPPGMPGDVIPSYGVGNVRLALAGNDWLGEGEFEVALWVRNVFDREYLVEGQGSFFQLHANRLGVYGDRRHAGVDLLYRY